MIELIQLLLGGGVVALLWTISNRLGAMTATLTIVVKDMSQVKEDVEMLKHDKITREARDV